AGPPPEVRLSAWLARHSEVLEVLGDHREDSRLPDVSRSALESRAAIAGRPPATPPGKSTNARGTRVEEKLLARALAAGKDADLRRLPYRDPAWYTARLRTAIEAPVQALDPSPCSRAVHLAARLRAVPEFLRQAQLNMNASGTTASRIGTRLALSDVDALLDACRTPMAESFTTCRESRFQAELAEADSIAVPPP